MSPCAWRSAERSPCGTHEGLRRLRPLPLPCTPAARRLHPPCVSDVDDPVRLLLLHAVLDGCHIRGRVTKAACAPKQERRDESWHLERRRTYPEGQTTPNKACHANYARQTMLYILRCASHAMQGCTRPGSRPCLVWRHMGDPQQRMQSKRARGLPEGAGLACIRVAHSAPTPLPGQWERGGRVSAGKKLERLCTPQTMRAHIMLIALHSLPLSRTHRRSFG